MAFAERKEIEVTTTVNGVGLTLTAEEAQTLRDLVSYVSGNWNTSRRKHTENIAGALSLIGINCKDAPDIKGGIRFEEV